MMTSAPVQFNRRIHKWATRFSQLLLLAVLANKSYAVDSWLDLVRVEDGKFSREIIYQQKLDQWQSPVSLTKDSRTDDFTPVSIRIRPTTALVLWKESIGVDASRLRYSLLEFDSDGLLQKTGAVLSVKTVTAHQSSPTLIRGPSGQIWGFWVGFNGKEDDIYYARFGSKGWGAETRVYDTQNEVPDLRPTARVNTNGVLELRWRQFSFDKGRYVDVFSTFVRDAEGNDKWFPPAEYVLNPLEKRPGLPEDFTLPEGVSQPDTVAIHYSAFPDIALHWNYLPVKPDTSDAEKSATN